MFHRALPLLLTMVAAASVASANDVSVFVKNGKLTVKGDVDANVLTFVGLPNGSIRVTPSGATTLNGGSDDLIVGGALEAVSFSLGDGVDQIVLNDLTLSGKVEIKMGKGSDRLTMNLVTLTGPLKVDLGEGDNSISICGSTLAETSLKLGKGTGGPVGASCNNDLVTTTNASAFAIVDVTTTGDVTVKGSAGVNIGVIDDTSVDGTLTFGNIALLALCYSDVNGGLTAKMPKVLGNDGGSVSCVGGDTEAFANGNTAVAMARYLIDGAFTVKGGAGGDSVVVTGTGIDEGTSLSLGGGTNFLFLQIVQTASFLAKAGKDDDDFFADTLRVFGDTTVKYGGGDNVIELTASTVDGDLTMKTGAGDDTISDINNTVVGTTQIDPGKGMNTLND